MTLELKSVPIVTGFRAAGICFLVSSAIGLGFVLRQRGFGASDLPPFLLWSLAFSSAVGVSNAFLAKWVTNTSSIPWARCMLALAVAVGLVVVWSSLVNLVLGPWALAFGFPITPAWIAGALTGTFIVTCLSVVPTGGGLIWIAGIGVAVALVTVVITEPIASLLTGDQQVTVMFARLEPGGIGLVIEDDLELLSEELKALAEGSGIRGLLRIQGGSVEGSGPLSSALVIMETQIGSPVELALPDRSMVVYVQQGSDWLRFPADTPTLSRRILLHPESGIDWNTTVYAVELATGGLSGGDAVSWPADDP